VRDGKRPELSKKKHQNQKSNGSESGIRKVAGRVAGSDTESANADIETGTEQERGKGEVELTKELTKAQQKQRQEEDRKAVPSDLHAVLSAMWHQHEECRPSASEVLRCVALYSLIVLCCVTLLCFVVIRVALRCV
jgi:hypothetical protein